ncbi:hypothetical protein HQ81_0143 [Dickeya phage phiDP23.1]|uniref:Uncharacterized protein n=9 Tax=Aglimvirinae TaxID=2169530 RepID=A0A7M3T474_9CAUD|nr:hypothetical protein HQ80_0164 [Dickeya phage phiD3]AIM51645.1 hypothetical protein HQ82_0017 [Dickeya phage phiDP10.3]AIM51979.1 hypothetical protein HQ81_0143 [Dickeya phage phiDP23.1]AYN55546.1 hypothetical protein [Dickeya phage Coodle]AYN55750.1 hypothetical protein [Dickeya phage Kamild]QHB42080.1 hypothetical protein [Dickeya phage Ds16CZ]QHB42478.1 hypothetical protein [Dickeya phage Ds23CZ]QHB42676.1 hypothetical protein [Dickeya phage Ds25CZ]QHB42911.1 hypothetical protein [Dic
MIHLLYKFRSIYTGQKKAGFPYPAYHIVEDGLNDYTLCTGTTLTLICDDGPIPSGLGEWELNLSTLVINPESRASSV